MQPAVVVAQHRDDDRQREVGVVHAALLAAAAVRRVGLLAGAQRGDDLALAGDDPEVDVGAHRGGQHRADQHEGRAAGKQLAGQPGREDDDRDDGDRDPQVAVAALAERAADRVVDQPEGKQQAQRGERGGRRRPVEDLAVDQEGAGIEQVHQRKQRKAGQPGAVALPVRPVQPLGQRPPARRDQVLVRVVEAAAVHRPQLAVDAPGAQLGVVGPRQAVVEHDEVERRADPGDRGDHMRPAQQQVEPLEQVGVHAQLPR